MARKKRTKSTAKRTSRKKSESDETINGIIDDDNDSESKQETPDGKIELEVQMAKSEAEVQMAEGSGDNSSNYMGHKKFGKYRCLERRSSSSEEEEYEVYNTNDLMPIDIQQIVLGDVTDVTIHQDLEYDMTDEEEGIMNNEVACDIVIENVPEVQDSIYEAVEVYKESPKEVTHVQTIVEEKIVTPVVDVFHVTKSENDKCYTPKKSSIIEINEIPNVPSETRGLVKEIEAHSPVESISASSVHALIPGEQKNDEPDKELLKIPVPDISLNIHDTPTEPEPKRPPEPPKGLTLIDIIGPAFDCKELENLTSDKVRAIPKSPKKSTATLSSPKTSIESPKKLSVMRSESKKLPSASTDATIHLASTILESNKKSIPAVSTKKQFPIEENSKNIMSTETSRKSSSTDLLNKTIAIQDKSEDVNSKKVNGEEIKVAKKEDSQLNKPESNETNKNNELKKPDMNNTSNVRRRSNRIRTNRWEDVSPSEVAPPPPLLPPAVPPPITTTPPPLIFEPDKPVKVKSRWRRTSELEMGTGITSDSDQSISTLSIKSPQNSPCHVDMIKLPLSTVHPEIDERLKSFELITSNIFLTIRKRSKEAKRMLCDCTLSKEETAKGEKGCGEDCLNRLLMIECGSRCSLGNLCSNKRFQNFEYANCEVVKTVKKGLGLITSIDVGSGNFLMEYVGEVIDPKEFRRRAKDYAKEKNRHFYFMALKSDTVIDATVKGNISRFINHSCDPNSETQKWTVNGELRIGFFSKRPIARGEEITFDYQLQRYGKEAQRCYCESLNCRGWIGEDPDKEKERDEKDKSWNKKERKEKKRKEEKRRDRREYLNDMDLEEEIEKLSSSGVKNQAHTLTLSRLMVRAEDHTSRSQLLTIAQAADQRCLRLFVDYHGLALIWSWMMDIQSPPKFKIEILNTLAALPITNKTILQDSKILCLVEKWANPEDLSSDKKERSGEDFTDGSPDSEEASKPESCNSQDVPIVLPSEEDSLAITEKSKALVHNWAGLKEEFRIPKKERIEQMKEHEREADRGYGDPRENQSYDSRRGMGYRHWTHERERDSGRQKDKDRKRGGRDSPDSDWRTSKERNGGALGGGPRLTKVQRRQLFALKVEEEERQKRQVEELWNKHQEQCSALGLDPAQTPLFNQHNGFPGFYHPQSGTWQQFPPDGAMESDIQNMFGPPGSGPPPMVNQMPPRVFPPNPGGPQGFINQGMGGPPPGMGPPPGPVIGIGQLNSGIGPPGGPVMGPQGGPPGMGPSGGPPTGPPPGMVPPGGPPPGMVPPGGPPPGMGPPGGPPPGMVPPGGPPPGMVPPGGPPPGMVPPGGPPPGMVPPGGPPPGMAPPGGPPPGMVPPGGPPPGMGPPGGPPPGMVPQGGPPGMGPPGIGPPNLGGPPPGMGHPPNIVSLPGPFPGPPPSPFHQTPPQFTQPPPPLQKFNAPPPITFQTPPPTPQQPQQVYPPFIPQQPPPALDVLKLPPPIVTTTPQANVMIENTPQPPLPPLPAPRKLPPRWKSAKDHEGRTYFYHTKVRTSQWQFPTPEHVSEAEALVAQQIVADEETESEDDESDSEEDESSTEEEEEKEEEEEEEEVGFLMDTTKRKLEEETVLVDQQALPNEPQLGDEEEYSPTQAVQQEFEPALKKRREGLVQPRDDEVNYRKGVKKSKIRETKEKLARAKHKQKSSRSSRKAKSCEADSSGPSRRIKDKFRVQMANVIVALLNPYRKQDCKIARIQNTEDFKHLARKLTHFVMVKELRHCATIEELECNDNVKHKARDFIKKYMAKFGSVYTRISDE